MQAACLPRQRARLCACVFSPLQAEAAGLERELAMALRQIDSERSKQEEMAKEKER
jgi:hypothetical protein